MLEKIIEVKVNRKELEKAIEEMELFGSLKTAIEEFHKDEARLKDQVAYVEKQILESQQKLTQNMLDQGSASVADSIKLKKKTKGISEEIAILDSVLGEVKAGEEELLYKYYIKFMNALGNASVIASEFDFTPILTSAIAEILAVASELSQDAAKQYAEVYPDISYVLFDDRVIKRYPRAFHSFTANTYKPRFNWSERTVLDKDQVNNAIWYGDIPNDFKIKEVVQDGK